MPVRAKFLFYDSYKNYNIVSIEQMGVEDHNECILVILVKYKTF